MQINLKEMRRNYVSLAVTEIVISGAMFICQKLRNKIYMEDGNLYHKRDLRKQYRPRPLESAFNHDIRNFYKYKSFWKIHNNQNEIRLPDAIFAMQN